VNNSERLAKEKQQQGCKQEKGKSSMHDFFTALYYHCLYECLRELSRI